MEIKAKEIREYLTEDGRSPFRDWFGALKDMKAKAKIRVRLDLLESGNFGDCKSVGDGVSELRIDFGPGYRVYIGFDGEILVLLLCGGSKKSQQNDIRKAKEYWQNYRRRKNESVIPIIS
ncbi:MAG TPA: addiction module protein [Desulfobacteraceae bacterium]|nr:addiction module protein [Desulfobacteraceae bacterium]